MKQLIWPMYCAFMLGVLATVGLMMLFSGCYDARVAEPCDAEVLSDSSTVELPTVNREDAGSSPAWTATPCIPYNPRDCFCQEPTHVYCKAGTQTWEQYADFLANTD